MPPLQPGHTVSSDCQECTCEASTWTMSCRRQPCAPPPACPEPGLVPVPASPQAGQCCPQYTCGEPGLVGRPLSSGLPRVACAGSGLATCRGGSQRWHLGGQPRRMGNACPAMASSGDPSRCPGRVGLLCPGCQEAIPWGWPVPPGEPVPHPLGNQHPWRPLGTTRRSLSASFAPRSLQHQLLPRAPSLSRGHTPDPDARGGGLLPKPEMR